MLIGKPLDGDNTRFPPELRDAQPSKVLAAKHNFNIELTLTNWYCFNSYPIGRVTDLLNRTTISQFILDINLNPASTVNLTKDIELSRLAIHFDVQSPFSETQKITAHVDGLIKFSSLNTRFVMNALSSAGNPKMFFLIVRKY